MTAEDQAREAVARLIAPVDWEMHDRDAERDWHSPGIEHGCRISLQTAGRVIATMREMGWKTVEEFNHIFAAYETAFYERDALRAQVEGMTSDEAVEAACRADVGLGPLYEPSDGKKLNIKAALAAAVAAAKGEG